MAKIIENGIDGRTNSNSDSNSNSDCSSIGVLWMTVHHVTIPGSPAEPHSSRYRPRVDVQQPTYAAISHCSQFSGSHTVVTSPKQSLLLLYSTFRLQYKKNKFSSHYFIPAKYSPFCLKLNLVFLLKQTYDPLGGLSAGTFWLISDF
ncbi:hypothetical protein O181_002673 [Austropuccinia psidii MF-1]|uniref:Uncharacterized protein n=1 Tax=Austropuccinia psidii MF-1 TaxID=1389203 RepID=A0A9Q3BD63_9BASI|nr:hypothetical protein [Austropuccinia psidii MF-1]